eukprot:scaffold840_cov29-Prasinocladus_malaysianus.AAC.2
MQKSEIGLNETDVVNTSQKSERFGWREYQPNNANEVRLVALSIAACWLQNFIRYSLKRFRTSVPRCTKLAASLEAATKAAEVAGKKSARLEELLGKNEDRRIGADAERRKAVDGLAGAKREADEGRRKLAVQE